MNINKPICVGICILLGLICIDQFFKIQVKLHFNYGEKKSLIGNWLIVYFVENDGMAMGRKYMGDFGKVILTTIRILHSILLMYFIFYLFKNKMNFKVIIIAIFLLAGNISNTLDNIFYAAIFNDKRNNQHSMEINPSFFKKEKLFFGKVVDYIYFNKFNEIKYPQWVPIIGNKKINSLDVVFNLADIYIYLAIIGIIIYYKKVVTTIYLIQLKWLNE